jgi:hypothetical protein
MALLVAAAFGVADGPQAYADRKRSDRCYTVRVRAADSPGERDRRRHKPVFSAGEAKDLTIEVTLSEDAATRPVQVKLFTPRGRLYQVLDAVAEGNRTARPTRSRRHERILVAQLPVAGTQVTAHALFGEWRAEVHLDGAETPCIRPLSFVIEP